MSMLLLPVIEFYQQIHFGQLNEGYSCTILTLHNFRCSRLMPVRESCTAIHWVIFKGDVQEVLLTCLIASTTVTVFPVPGGPNTRYGAGRDDPDKIF